MYRSCQIEISDICRNIYEKAEEINASIIAGPVVSGALLAISTVQWAYEVKKREHLTALFIPKDEHFYKRRGHGAGLRYVGATPFVPNQKLELTGNVLLVDDIIETGGTIYDAIQTLNKEEKLHIKGIYISENMIINNENVIMDNIWNAVPEETCRLWIGNEEINR